MRYSWILTGTALLLWAPFFVRGQGGIPPVVSKEVIPGASLARAYPAKVLEKPGDFNKSYIRALVILDGDEPVGIKVAGHSEEAICRQTSNIVLELALALDEKQLTFGQLDSPEGYYVGYGIFDGPVNAKYRKLYRAAYTELQQLYAAHPTQMELRTMPLADFNRYRSQLLQYEQAGKDVLVVHVLPEEFMLYRPQGSLDQAGLLELHTQVKAAATEEYQRKLAADERRLQRLQQQLPRVVFPEQYRAFHPQPGDFSTKNEPADRRDARHAALLRDAMDTPEFRLKAQSNQTVVEELRGIVAELHDSQLREGLENYLNEVALVTNYDSLLKSIREKLVNQELRTGRIDSVRIEFTPAKATGLNEVLNRYLVNYRTFLTFAEGFGAKHPWMLTDAMVRGWPTLAPEDFPAVYAAGTGFRAPNEIVSEYHFLAANPEQPVRGVSVSGVVFQYCTEGTCQYLNYEDFLESAFILPGPRQLLSNFVRYFELAPDFPLVIQWPGKAAERFTVGELPKPILATADSTTLQSIARGQPAFVAALSANGHRFELAGQTHPQGLYQRAGDTLSTLDLNIYNNDLYRHAVRRWALDRRFAQALAAKIEVPLRMRWPLADSLAVALQGWALPADARPLPERLAPQQRSEAAAQYTQLQLALQQRLADADLFGILPTEQSFESYRDNLLENLPLGKTSTDADLRTLLGFVRDLYGFVEIRATDEWTAQTPDPDPNRIFVGETTWHLVEFVRYGQRLRPAYLAQVVAHQLLLQHGDTRPLDPGRVGAALKALERQAVSTGLLNEDELKTPTYLAGLAYGLFQLGEAEYAKLKPLGENPPQRAALETRLRNVYQPVLVGLLNHIAGQSPPDELDFIVRNLKISLDAFPDTAVLW